MIETEGWKLYYKMLFFALVFRPCLVFSKLKLIQIIKIFLITYAVNAATDLLLHLIKRYLLSFLGNACIDVISPKNRNGAIADG